MKLIVEMEMPKNGCCDCMVELMGLCVIQDKDVPLKNENGDYPTELPKGCPIKGVLPDEHGDLIDADEVWKRAGRKGEADMIALAREFCNAPIVIVAERKDDE